MSLFADLYGYWEPPAGWKRTSDGALRASLHHPEHGNLMLETIYDDDDIKVTWIPGAERKVTASELAKAFLADGHQVTRFHVNVPIAGQVTWVMRPQSFWERLFGGR
jgi:hypothetical protein